MPTILSWFVPSYYFVTSLVSQNMVHSTSIIGPNVLEDVISPLSTLSYYRFFNFLVFLLIFLHCHIDIILLKV